MSNHSIKPEDILPEGIDNLIINDKPVRKGTIAAFLKNAAILDNADITAKQKQEAITTMKELAPAIIALGLHHQVVFKNSEVEQLLVEANRMQEASL